MVQLVIAAITTAPSRMLAFEPFVPIEAVRCGAAQRREEILFDVGKIDAVLRTLRTGHGRHDLREIQFQGIRIFRLRRISVRNRPWAFE